MKLSFICGRADASGRHNDRNFDVSKADHIISDRSADNKYWTYNGSNESFRDLELNFYKETFGAYLDERADRLSKQRQSGKRKMTTLGYYTHQNTRPEDVIIQVGNYQDHIEPDELWNVVTQYIEDFNQKYGNNCKILDAALHVDEETVKSTGEVIKGTPHVHIRRVWMYEDELGNKRVGQTKALEEIGYVKLDANRKNSKTNNNKTLFTKRERAELHKQFEAVGISLDHNGSEKAEHLTVKEYKAKKNLEMVNDRLDRIRSAMVRLAEKHGLDDDKEFKKAKAGSDPVKLVDVTSDLLEARAISMANLEAQAAIAEKEAYKRRMEYMIRFLKDKELYDEYVKQNEQDKNKR